MKILHTSDWHLGRTLYDKKRYDEFEAFLTWFKETIIRENAEVLIIAGDIFDTVLPTNQAQELYYSFLAGLSATSCKHVVITGGNHDSPSFLNAPKRLFKALNISVIGSVTENPKDEVVTVYDGKTPKAVICAVPYLRDKEIRTIEAGETIDDKNLKILQGIKNHYDIVCKVAQEKIEEYGKQGHKNIPLIATGHLFAAKGKTVEGDGVRDLYVGNLVQVSASQFPENIDYLALGHLHIAQTVSGKEHMRYSGSPIPMGFGEAKQQKVIVKIEFSQNGKTIESIPVPTFQHLERLRGSLETLTERINELKSEKRSIWLEIEYEGSAASGTVRERLAEATEGSEIEILCIKNMRILNSVLTVKESEASLDNLTPNYVFERVLESPTLDEKSRNMLKHCFEELLKSFAETDINAK